MSAVRLYHPDLPDRSVDVDELAVPHLAAAGWTTEPPQPPADSAPAADTPKDPADTGTKTEAAPRKAAARARAPKEAEQQ